MSTQEEAKAAREMHAQKFPPHAGFTTEVRVLNHEGAVIIEAISDASDVGGAISALIDNAKTAEVHLVIEAARLTTRLHPGTPQ